MIDALTLDEVNTIIDIFGFKPSDVSISKCESCDVDHLRNVSVQLQCARPDSEVVFMSISKFFDSMPSFVIHVFDKNTDVIKEYIDITDIYAGDFDMILA